MKKLFVIILLLLCLTANVGQSQSLKMFGQMLNLGHWSTDGLVFYWRGIPAGNVVDESLYRNHGTITSGLTWNGAGLRWSNAASTDHITLDTKITWNDTEPWTIIVSCKKDSGSPALRGGVLGGDSDSIPFLWYYSTQNKWRLQSLDSDDITDFSYSNADITDQHTFAFISDGINLHFYVDGIFFETDINANGDTSFEFPEIGRGVGTSGWNWEGTIGSVSAYSRSLSAGEILALYINPDLPMQKEPIWLMYSPVAPSGIIPIIQAHTRRRRAG